MAPLPRRKATCRPATACASCRPATMASSGAPAASASAVGGERVAHVVQARQRQRDLGLPRRRVQLEARAFGAGEHAAGAHVGVVLDAEAEAAPVADHRLEPGREGVVGVDHRDAVVGQRLVDRALGLGDAEQAAHALHVRGRDVVDQRHLRRRDAGEVGDVARLAGAHLVDREVRRPRARRAPPAAGRSRCCGCRDCSRCGRRATRMPVTSVLTEVLPLLPVSATTTAGRPFCMPAAISPSASSVSAHSTRGSSALDVRCSSSAVAPLAAACATKSWPSKFSPRSATNSAPAGSLRLSVATAPIWLRRRDGGLRPRSPAARAAPASCRRLQQVASRPAGRRRHGARLRLPGRPRGPCRRSARRRRNGCQPAPARSRDGGRARTLAAAGDANPATISRDDRVAVLAARIVVGDDDAVGAALRRSPPSAGACRGRGRRRSRTRRSGGPGVCSRRLASACSQRVGRVRVVDHHQRLAVVAAGAAHAPVHRRQLRQHRRRRLPAASRARAACRRPRAGCRC